MTPRGFAIVGASERGIPWTEWLMASLGKHDYPGEIWLVNPRRPELHGRRTYPDLEALPGPPEVAAILTGADQALVQVEALVRAGCRRLMVVSNGFGELGTPEGRQREQRLRELAAADDVLLVGPNCVGFASLHEGICAISQPVPHGLVPGDVSIVSQSGGLTGAALGAVQRQGLGIDVAFSLGNGTAFGVADALVHAVSRETTRVVLGVVESITDGAQVERAAAVARERGALLVLLLLGASEGGANVARSHTGAVVGSHRNLASWLHGLGIVTVASIEELARVASVSAAVGTSGHGAMIATISGGGAGLAADLASRHGVQLARLAPATVERLRGALPEGAYIGNPLDISTGDAAAVYAALSDDPGVRFLLEPWSLPFPTDSDEYHWQRAAVGRLADLSDRSGMPVLISSIWEQAPSTWLRDSSVGTGLEVSSSLELTLAALGRLSSLDRVDGDLRRPVAATAARAAEVPGAEPGAYPTGAMVAEAAARSLLQEAGVPVVAGGEVADADALVALAASLTGPFAVKLSVGSVGHKERIGGVVLGVDGETALRAACARIRANALAAGVSDGSDVRFLLTEMVSGPEILVGVIRDPLTGPCVTVGIGGWAAEAGALFGTIALPADRSAIEGRVRDWELARLLGPTRAGGLGDFLVVLSDAARGRLSEFAEIEINPVMLTGRGAVAVDALLVR